MRDVGHFLPACKAAARSLLLLLLAPAVHLFVSDPRCLVAPRRCCRLLTFVVRRGLYNCPGRTEVQADAALSVALTACVCIDLTSLCRPECVYISSLSRQNKQTVCGLKAKAVRVLVMRRASVAGMSG